MQYRSGKEVRDLFIKFWESHGCHHYKSFSLIPDDPSLLFTIAGMVPFKKYYLGLEEPEYPRAVTSQKCVRTNDIENVGHTARHHTFFEMLGNFSWGGYFKRESLTWGWDFLTNVLGLDGSRMYASIFKDDQEAFDIWTKEIGLPESHIVFNGEDENFWYMGPQGPCGPDSEIMYDQGEEYSCGPDCHPGCDCDRFLEIWNHVFTQYDRQADGSYKPLPRKNIDTGMGLERLVSLIQGVRNDFETDLFTPIMKKAGEIAGIKYGDSAQGDLALKVISDHVRSVAFMISDGILPANDGQGYVLRRLLRRAARYGRLIGINRPFINDVIPTVIAEMGDPYSELIENRLTIEKIVEIEENSFSKTIRQGSELLDVEVKNALASNKKVISGEAAFQLYDTYGFPLELTKEICEERGVTVDEEAFKAEMERQRERARSSSKQIANNVIKGNVFNALFNEFGATTFVGYEKGECVTRVRALVKDGQKVERLAEGDDGMVLLESSPFYAERGGQIGDTGLIQADGVLAVVKDSTHPFGELNMQTVTVTKGELKVGQSVNAAVDMERHLSIARNHTATHILHAVLGKVLGGHVRQNGSLVSDRFLRFDYTHYEAPTAEQLEEIETQANAAILRDMPVSTLVTDLEAAKATGAKALFEEKYGKVVRVVSVGDFSSELCGGTHVSASGVIGSLKIISDESIGSGIRRITAVTGMSTIHMLQEMHRTVEALSGKLAVKPVMLVQKVESMEEEIKELKRQIDAMSREKLADSIDSVIAKKALAGGINLYVGKLDGEDMNHLREAGDKYKDSDPNAVFIVFSQAAEDKVQLLCMIGEEAQNKKLHAGRIVKELAAIVGGSGGGRPNMAQAGGKDPSKIPAAAEAAVDVVTKMIGA
ncbi:MAG: alanine--tRNA ligase [Pyramidobacter sp.]|nr:alanine--tRNA ligase [Pyramidobacter sp.]